MLSSKQNKKRLVLHVKQRALERAELFLTCQDITSISGMIRNGKSTPIDRGRNTKTRQWHTVVWQGTKFDVLYSGSTHSIVTILPTRTEKS